MKYLINGKKVVEADLLEIKSSGHAVFMRLLNEAECFGLGQVYTTKFVIEPKEYWKIEEIENGQE